MKNDLAPVTLISPDDYPDRDASIASALELGRAHSFEEPHGLHTAALALRIFDGLMELHGMTERTRVMLECAGILHDIGSAYGDKGHHKRSMELILSRGLYGFDPVETLQIALVARYHRKSFPTAKHARFADLPKGEREMVVRLSSMLRVADGLDRTHRGIVEDVACSLTERSITLACTVRGRAEAELAYGLNKSDLMRSVFMRRVKIGKT
jgi:exopolyphosphatase/pppGpp-phosphohydrolase